MVGIDDPSMAIEGLGGPRDAGQYLNYHYLPYKHLASTLDVNIRLPRSTFKKVVLIGGGQRLYVPNGLSTFF